MEVYLTVDTECTEERLVNGRIRPPVGYDLMMRGRFEGHRNGFGTDFLIRELARYGFRATFFMEVLCSEHFGLEGLTSVCRDLQNAGQDLQLHLHPNFRRPEWRANGGEAPADNIGEFDLETQISLLAAGIDILNRAGVPKDAIVAFRAGNYGASNLTWQALKRVGLSIDSSFNLWGIGTEGWCLIDDGERNDLYEAIPGLWELPVSCFRESHGFRHLEITAISSSEMRHTLSQLHAAGTRAATIVLHPGEFFVIDDHEHHRGRPNTINIARFRNLLRFLNGSRNRFQVRTVGALAAELRTAGLRRSDRPDAIPRGSHMRKLARLPVQAIKRTLMRPRN
jgi:hypothetical protein